MHKIALSLALALLWAGCSDSGTPSRPKIVSLPSLSINDITVAEGASGAFTVTLSPASSDSVSFGWHFGGGTATLSTDYTAQDGSATLAPGELSRSIPVSVLTDSAVESGESFEVTLRNPTGAVIGRATGTGTIPGVSAAVTFAHDIQPLVQSRCAISGCHGGGSHEGGLNLGGAGYSTIRNAHGGHGSFIGGTPPSSSQSLFFLVVRPGSTSGVPRMPESGGFLSTQQQTMIRDWIDQGALDN